MISKHLYAIFIQPTLYRVGFFIVKTMDQIIRLHNIIFGYLLVIFGKNRPKEQFLSYLGNYEELKSYRFVGTRYVELGYANLYNSMILKHRPIRQYRIYIRLFNNKMIYLRTKTITDVHRNK